MGATSQKTRFSLIHEGNAYQVALGPSEVAYIGRASRSVIVLDDVSISGQHVELSVTVPSGLTGKPLLCARDRSRNGTGVREPGAAGGVQEQIVALNSEQPQPLQDGCQLFVPFRRRGASALAPEEVAIASIKVQLLPDALEPMPVLSGYPPHPPVLSPPPAVAAPGHASGSPALIGRRPLPMPKVLPVATKGSNGTMASGATAAAPGAPASAAVLWQDAEMLPDVYDPVSRTGRWRYDARLGEGGLGVVYRAHDCTGPHGEVAVKVLKPRSRDPQRDARFVFEMHRESQWSLWWLHNEYDCHYSAEPATLFARYLEDHTGFSKIGTQGFDAKRKAYEAPDFDWERDGPKIPARPYVVMELVKGEALHVAIDRDRRSQRPDTREDKLALAIPEKRAVLLQAARALEYLASFGLIHRDFRGCNMHLVSRRGDANGVQLKVLDLGVMICAEDGQEENSNQAVQAFRRRGETEEKRRRYDWLPWEVRAGADGTGPAVNFAPPAHSFDIFSLGVLILHMLIGRVKARSFLDALQNNKRSRVDTASLGLDPALLLRMLGEPAERPHPSEVVKALSSSPGPNDLHVPSREAPSRSRSRGRKSELRSERNASAESVGKSSGQDASVLHEDNKNTSDGSTTQIVNGAQSQGCATDQDEPASRMMEALSLMASLMPPGSAFDGEPVVSLSNAVGGASNCWLLTYRLKT